jgi:O-acetyl-ADP-ribose deacetylase
MVRERIGVILGDITEQKVDAIVNAASNSLLGGGGVDGAIHRVAGPELLEECRGLGGCETGQAKITRGYNLSAQWVIHTVGPVWRGSDHNENELLAQCYRSCFALADEYAMKTIAFPSISAGDYGFPLERAARIAVTEVKEFLEGDSTLEKVLLVCFSERAYQCYLSVVEEIVGSSQM